MDYDLRASIAWHCKFLRHALHDIHNEKSKAHAIPHIQEYRIVISINNHTTPLVCNFAHMASVTLHADASVKKYMRNVRPHT